MNDKFFKNLDFSPQKILDQLYEESKKEENYYLSPVGVWRCDVSQDLRSKISKIINVPFADCGFLKTKPKNTYPVHKDVYRIAAINLPMFEPHKDFMSFVLSKEGIKFVDYKKDHFLILNVMEFHGVNNNSESQERVVLSIGIKEKTYQELLELHSQGKLINAV